MRTGAAALSLAALLLGVAPARTQDAAEDACRPKVEASATAYDDLEAAFSPTESLDVDPPVIPRALSPKEAEARREASERLSLGGCSGLGRSGDGLKRFFETSYGSPAHFPSAGPGAPARDRLLLIPRLAVAASLRGKAVWLVLSNCAPAKAGPDGSLRFDALQTYVVDSETGAVIGALACGE